MNHPHLNSSFWGTKIVIDFGPKRKCNLDSVSRELSWSFDYWPFNQKRRGEEIFRELFHDNNNIIVPFSDYLNSRCQSYDISTDTRKGRKALEKDSIVNFFEKVCLRGSKYSYISNLKPRPFSRFRVRIIWRGVWAEAEEWILERRFSCQKLFETFREFHVAESFQCSSLNYQLYESR